MFKIGEFARLAQTSVKTLHHYDEIGLLRPGQVDEATGYRFYDAAQLPRLLRIFALKDLGFSLEQIGEILDADLSHEQILTLLRLKRGEAEDRVRAEQARLDQINRRLERMEREGGMGAYEVQIKAVPAEEVAALRIRIADMEAEATTRMIGEGFERLYGMLVHHRIRFGGPSIVYWQEVRSLEESGEILVATPCSFPHPPGLAAAGIESVTLPPETTVAAVVHHGPVSTLYGAFIALFDYLAANSLRVCGPRRDLVWQYRPDAGKEMVNEVQFPVAPSKKRESGTTAA